MPCFFFFFFVGVTLLILTEPIRFFLFVFFFPPVQCHQIDVVSGCGKNAEGAVQTLSLVFHNLSQKHLTPAPPKLFTLNSHS